MKVKYTPPGTINWGDMKPQKPWQELTISDLIPNERDGQELHRRAVRYIMRFLVSVQQPFQSSALSSCSPLAPSCNQVCSSTNANILDALRADTGLTGDPQVEKTVFVLVLSSNSLTIHVNI